MNSRFQLLDDGRFGAGAQHTLKESGQEMQCGSRAKRAALAVFGVGVLLLGGAAVVLQRGSARSTAERNDAAPTTLTGGNRLRSGLSGRSGGDRVSHGCIGSAGYIWCASEAECIRPWEHHLTSQHEITGHCGTDGAASSLVLGGDRDSYRCIGSAGYSWCASLSECIRPWEHNLTSERDIAAHCGDSSFAVSSLAVTAETRGPVGGDRDAHGCIGSAGYCWCALMSECIRPWEHRLTSEHDFAEQCGDSLSGIAASFLVAAETQQDLVGSDRDAHGCIGSAGYSWCASMSECIRPWEHNLTSEREITEHCGESSSGAAVSAPAVAAEMRGPFGGDRDAHGCVGSSGYRWCNSISECIRPWEHNLTSEHEIGELCRDSSSGTVLSRTYPCNCPPTMVFLPCSREQYQSIMNGTDCAYYRQGLD